MQDWILMSYAEKYLIISTEVTYQLASAGKRME